MKHLRITVLGSGTSSGVPIIGCDCPVCRSENPRNKRLRSSALLETDKINILIDTPPDLRQQCLRYKVRQVDAVLYTHEHADHILGCDDLRSFNFLQGCSIPAYGNERTVSWLQTIFAYFTNPVQRGGGVPKVEFHVVREPFDVCGVRVVPIPVWHGKLEVYGYRIGPFAYVNDCNYIPPESMEALRGLEVLILDALRIQPHSTHFNLEQAVETARELKVPRVFFTHLTHDIEHEAISRELPQGMRLAYDGLVIDV